MGLEDGIVWKHQVDHLEAFHPYHQSEATVTPTEEENAVADLGLPVLGLHNAGAGPHVQVEDVDDSDDNNGMSNVNSRPYDNNHHPDPYSDS